MSDATMLTNLKGVIAMKDREITRLRARETELVARLEVAKGLLTVSHPANGCDLKCDPCDCGYKDWSERVALFFDAERSAALTKTEERP